MFRKQGRPKGTARNRLMDNLQTSMGMSNKDNRLLRESITTPYVRRYNANVPPGNGWRSRKLDRKTTTLDKIPLNDIVEAVEAYMERNIQADLRPEIYGQVMGDIPGRQAAPDWANPNKIPQTPFSVSRALISELGSAAGLKAETQSLISARIILLDAIANSLTSSGCMVSSGGNPEVTGGRLGRDHTLDDVPNNFVRDCIMDYINNEMNNSTQQTAAWRSVFSDLSAAETAEYSALVQQIRQNNQDGDHAHDPLYAIKDAEFNTMRFERTYRWAALPIAKVNDVNEAQSFANQVKALRTIDTAVDLTPRDGYIVWRNYNRIEPIMRSVVRPLQNTYAIINNLLPVEETLHRFRVGNKVNRDCDQLRAMIKSFVTTRQRALPDEYNPEDDDSRHNWSLDQFRLALKIVTRPDLIHFLNKRGPKGGEGLKVHQLAWEFFRKREMLGLPIVVPVPAPAPPPAAAPDGSEQEVHEVADATAEEQEKPGNAVEGFEEVHPEQPDQTEQHEQSEQNDEPDEEDPELDEFHDARETPTAISISIDASSDEGSDGGAAASDGEDKPNDSAGLHSEFNWTESGAVFEQQPVPETTRVGTRASSKRARAGTVAAATETRGTPVEPAPLRKRLRSGRNL